MVGSCTVYWSASIDGTILTWSEPPYKTISIQEWWEPENGIRPDGAVPEWVHGMVMMMLFCQCVLGRTTYSWTPLKMFDNA